MKAEERKEIETNKLGAWLSRMKTKLQGRSLYMLVGSLLLATAAVLIIWFWRSSTAAANSARWMELRAAMDSDDPKKYDTDIINGEKHNDKITVKIAKFMKARRIMYGDGMDRLGSPRLEDRNNALAKVEEGRKLYEEIAPDLKDMPVLQQEAWLSCAKAEETLMGIPKADLSGGFRGDPGKMVEYLKKAAAVNPGSDPSKSYEQRAATRSGQAQELADFYRRLTELSQKPDLDVPGIPRFPGGGLPPGFKPPAGLDLPPID